MLLDNSQITAKIDLGALLFKDKRLSSDGTISCASCHQPDKAFADDLAVAEGIGGQQGVRNTPSLLNAAYMTTQFWDGRRETLEDQAQDPLFNPIEHGLTGPQQALDLVRGDADYRQRFQQVFNVSPAEIRMEHLAQAIAAFERTLLAGDSPFDRYQYGSDQQALTSAEREGLALFTGRAGCSGCHSIGEDSALFTDNRFHRLGVGFKKIESRLAEIARIYVSSADPAEQLSPLEISEMGRFVVTGKPADIGKFKTPSLRNVTLTAPYMHDGSVATLEEAVELEIYYRSQERARPLILTPVEKANLVAFLKALTSP
ncbi:cytochrome-c peroxidase [Marinobacterium arenosum]|uniref:cytochrome-c peroxidase n=1 Tax=Marinobacterium arenosum TaxID=2862496 RepID=UPI001C94FB4E|nr:cytochrome c peroxidase [Marinobacterium arenosum]MBY4678777.1 hypothetical protein [Marinobacterium arenosum]